MRVIVCGGRDFDDWWFLEETLDNLTEIMRRPGDVPPPISHVITGGAKGADSLASEWARKRGKAQTVYEAEWDRLGRRAGPVRNQRMLDEGKPDVVVAFPGGIGTHDMVKRARMAGVRVVIADNGGSEKKITTE